MPFFFKNSLSRDETGIAGITLPGCGDVPLGPAPEFGGKGSTIDPEHMFVGSVNGCLMQTFMYFASKQNVIVTSYRSDATGLLEKDSGGFRFTRVEVNAVVVVPETQDADEVKRLGGLADKYCLVTRSLNCPVEYNLSVRTQGVSES